jgi:hypothetical protein
MRQTSVAGALVPELDRHLDPVDIFATVPVLLVRAVEYHQPVAVSAKLIVMVAAGLLVMASSSEDISDFNIILYINNKYCKISFFL